MWRDPFLNLCFVVLVITLLAVQHSAGVFGPAAHSGAVTGLEGEFPTRLRAPASFGRATALLNEAWRHGIVFEDWWMEYNASQWELFNASSPAETDLLEARFHLANAEVFTEAMSENGRASTELARAQKSLAAAQAIVKADLNRRWTTVREEIAAAEITEQTEADFSTVPFETIKADLDRLIEIVRASKT